MNEKTPNRYGEDFERKNLLGCKTKGGEEAVVCTKEFLEVRHVGLNECLNGLKNWS